MRWEYSIVYGLILSLLCGGMVSKSQATGHTASMQKVVFVEGFLIDWAKDRYFQAAAKLAEEDIQVLINEVTKVLSKNDSRFEIGLHPVRFKTILPVGNKVIVRCVIVSERRPFGGSGEIFSYSIFEFDIAGTGTGTGISGISIKTRSFAEDECPARA